MPKKTVTKKTDSKTTGKKVEPKKARSAGKHTGELGVSSKSDFDLEELRGILQLLSDNDVTDFTLERGQDKLRLKRGAAPVQVQTLVQNVPTAPAPAAVAVPEAATESDSGKARQLHLVPSPAEAEVPAQTVQSTIELQQAAVERELIEVKSPMVGTFYRRPAVDAEPYVAQGDAIKKGDVLCIVEAMKLMNEIESEISGSIVEICLDDGQMVEYGEVLFRIEPS